MSLLGCFAFVMFIVVINKNVIAHLCVIPSPLLQHPSYGDCLEVKREYYQNSSVVDCVTQCSQSTAHRWGLSDILGA